MTAKQYANELVNEFRNILQDEDTECGNEILCTLIAKKCAKVAVKKIIEVSYPPLTVKRFMKVLNEIDNI